MSSKLQTALRKRFASPQEALRVLGLDTSLIEPRLANDKAEDKTFRQLLLALRAKTL
jgi:hypothetical protein